LSRFDSKKFKSNGVAVSEIYFEAIQVKYSKQFKSNVFAVSEIMGKVMYCVVTFVIIDVR